MTIDSDQSKAITIRVACRAGALILASEGFTAADAWGEKEIRSKGLGAEATVRRNENGRGGGVGSHFPAPSPLSTLTLNQIMPVE